jgi:hypothetical protein
MRPVTTVHLGDASSAYLHCFARRGACRSVTWEYTLPIHWTVSGVKNEPPLFLGAQMKGEVKGAKEIDDRLTGRKRKSSNTSPPLLQRRVKALTRVV